MWVHMQLNLLESQRGLSIKGSVDPIIRLFQNNFYSLTLKLACVKSRAAVPEFSGPENSFTAGEC